MGKHEEKKAGVCGGERGEGEQTDTVAVTEWYLLTLEESGSRTVYGELGFDGV